MWVKLFAFCYVKTEKFDLRIFAKHSSELLIPFSSLLAKKTTTKMIKKTSKKTTVQF